MKTLASLLCVVLFWGLPVAASAAMHPDVSTFTKDRIECSDLALDLKFIYAHKGTGAAEEGIMVWEEISTGVQLIEHWLRENGRWHINGIFLVMRDKVHQISTQQFLEMTARFGEPDKHRRLSEFYASCDKRIDEMEK